MSRQQDLVTRRRAVMGSAYELFYDQPLEVVRGEGCWLYDPDGNAYLDVYNNVPQVGHCHPHVVAAIQQQTATLNTHTRYLNEGVIAYAERLTGLCPAPLDIAMFTCTGTEANELALRMARVYTGASGVIVTRNAYHGNSWAVGQVSPEEAFGAPVGDHVALVPAPSKTVDFPRCVRAAMDTLRQSGHRTAALLVDTIFSSEGLVTPPAPGLREAAELVREAGGLVIADEVQAGFGRLGSHFWGFQAHDTKVDAITMGKPMGNGYPVAAMVSSATLVDQFSSQAGYFNTFGGNPVACAAANAVLDVLEDEDLQARALVTGTLLREGLEQLARRYPALGETRGSGLFLGTDTASPETARAIVNGLRQQGVLVGRTGLQSEVLKIRPPLVFETPHAELFLERIEKVLAGLEPAGGATQNP